MLSFDRKYDSVMMSLVSTVAALVIAGVVTRYQKTQQTNDDNEASEKTVVSHRLLDTEAQFYMANVPGYICTLTWLRGDYHLANTVLQKRLGLMIKKNPWLLGRIVFNCIRGTCHLSYVKQIWDENDTCVNLKSIFDIIHPSSSPISRRVPFGELSSILKDFGVLVENGRREPIFKTTIIPCSQNPQERFALLVQLSHVVGDGATYYKLLHMLCSIEEENIIELKPVRIVNTQELQIGAMGREEANSLISMGLAIRYFRGLVACWIRGTPTVREFGWVDTSKMKQIKEQSAKEAGIPFVSTNDVITSWFMKQTDCPMGYMYINWRNRLEGHTDSHVGNYENAIFYQKDDFATPVLVRKSFISYRRAVTGKDRLPSWWQIGTSRGSMVTNWMTFAKPIEVEGCEEDIHLPISSTQYFPDTMPLLVIFRAGVEKMGLLYYRDNEVNHLDFAAFLKKDIK